LEERVSALHVKHEAELEGRDAQLKNLKALFEEQQREICRLKETSTKQATEIAAYHQLLKSEEKRLSESVQFLYLSTTLLGPTFISSGLNC